MLRKGIVFVGIMFLFAKSVFSYLDPGTGGIIVNSLWQTILVIGTIISAFFVRRFWKPFKNFLKRE